VAPAVTGTATVGQTLSTTNGTWTGAPAPTFTYQWQRTGVNISGATSSTYVLVAADYANTIRCVVKATNSIAPSGVTANSNSTASVAGNAPVNTVAPAVTGTATVGQTLTTTNGTWTGVPTPTFTYQWQRVTTNISGATSSTYVLVDADAGNAIRCVVTGTNAVAAVAANSNATAAVAAIAPGAPTIGTATATGSTTATVAYTAPASNGGATITTYTATSSPGSITGTLSQAGSGTITVSGLTASTSYTFTVTATNSVGTSAASAASNSITTSAPPILIQSVFAVTAYTGISGSNVTITNGINLSANGGLIWTKGRNQANPNALTDTVRGVSLQVSTNATSEQSGSGISSFTTTGYITNQQGQTNGGSSETYVSWVFQKQSKLFDVVTWTGDGAATKTISHNLGSVPGCIMNKKTSASGDWWTYHRGATANPLGAYGVVNSSNAWVDVGPLYDFWNPTSTTFRVDFNFGLNTSGETYVAYLFAHDAGGFGEGGSQNVISCGSFNATSSGSVTLGYEPQWVLVKASSDVGSWHIQDSTRGYATSGNNPTLDADRSVAEFSGGYTNPTATGFTYGSLGSSFIYIAIRKPM
jgi:hypothetical protein